MMALVTDIGAEESYRRVLLSRIFDTQHTSETTPTYEGFVKFENRSVLS